MLRGTLIFTALLLTGRIVAGPTNVILRTTAEVRALSEDEMRQKIPVEFKGQVIAESFNGVLLFRDSTGGFILEGIMTPRPQVGDSVSLQGTTDVIDNYHQTHVFPHQVAILTHGTPPDPRLTDATHLSSGKDNFDLVKVRGFISEIFKDENNADWNYLIVRDAGLPVYVSVPNTGTLPIPFANLVDAEVEISGIALPHYAAHRMFVGPHLESWSKDCIKILRRAPEDPFTSPRLGSIFHTGPTELAKMRRCLVEGVVLAVWGKNKLLLREDDERLMMVDLANDQSSPKAGDRVQAVGFPATDLFRLNLSRALCKSMPNPHPPETNTARSVSPAEIFTDDFGRRRNDKDNRLLRQAYHGQLIRIRGVVRSLPSPGNGDDRMNLESDGYLVPVDMSANPSAADGLAIGCTIEATGICVMETEKWSPSNLFPVFGGFTLVLRSPNDIRVLSRPSWWTPTRLLIVIASLFAALVAFFVWNRILNRLVERRGRQLFKEQIAHAGAALKIGERTRLAVELHDALSQNLAGLACQISAAKTAIEIDSTQATNHLATAERMLLSSRTELRRCLWDLRGDTLELENMTEAVTKTVKPVVGAAELTVRFNVPRSRLMDSTAHSILCIVRELASNAVRHGHATHVRIAGEIHDGELTFSVRDDGTGFDVENCRGIAEGHFGLQGIRERINHLEGIFKLTSSNAGTRAKVMFHVPHATLNPKAAS